MKKCLIIGHGSIGKRHAEILHNQKCDVKLVTSQQTNSYLSYLTVLEALENHDFDYIIVANATYLHFQTLNQLMEYNYQGTILVEKPLFSEPNNIASTYWNKVFVAYNLRYSRLLHQLKDILANDELISFSVNVGQYLPTWRDNRDYRESYSAKKEWGGGVLTDLSHELDYIVWLCGKCLEVVSRGGHFSDLEINSDDVYSILMRCDRCPVVNLQLNYLDRIKRRDIIIHTKKHSIFIDLLKGTFNLDGRLLEITDSVSETYGRQHQALMSGDFSQACTYENGMDVLKMIGKIVEANHTRKWISV